MPSIDAPKYVTATVLRLSGPSEVKPGAYARLTSLAGTTLYSAQQAVQSAATYQKFLADGLTKSFRPVGFTAVSENSSVTAALQLRTAASINGVARLRAPSDAVVPSATTFVVAVGGGTAGGQADLTLKAATAVAVGDAAILVKEASGTGTVLIGDQITIAGDSTVYTVTGATYTLDATGVSIAVTPPIKKAVASGASNATAVTIAAPATPVVLFLAAPAANSSVEVFLHATGEITTVSGGALTAGKHYKEKLGSFLYSAGNVSVGL